MVEQMLGEFEEQIETISLLVSHGGAFEVTVDDRLVYSKKETGRHAEYEEVAAHLR